MFYSLKSSDHCLARGFTCDHRNIFRIKKEYSISMFSFSFLDCRPCTEDEILYAACASDFGECFDECLNILAIII